jgi:hypothetical protein
MQSLAYFTPIETYNKKTQSAWCIGAKTLNIFPRLFKKQKSPFFLRIGSGLYEMLIEN